MDWTADQRLAEFCTPRRQNEYPSRACINCIYDKFDLEFEKVREVRSPLLSFRSSKTDGEEVGGQIGVELEVHHAAELLNSPLVVFIRALAD